MAGPMVGISAVEIAQQKLQEQGAQPMKQGASKFDGILATKTQGLGAPDAAHASSTGVRTEHLRVVEPSLRSEKGVTHRVSPGAAQYLRAAAPATVSSSGEAGGLGGFVREIERGQVHMEYLIKAGLSGKHFSNAELLGLQAAMYKYTQELDLTSKVVEKATNGLKDTLKTQV